jgi:uncharacterized protein YjgD (DUF1641 family)
VAKPLSVILRAPEIPNRSDECDELQRKLQNAPAEHGAAILDAYELVQALHDRGTLDLLRGLVGASEEIMSHVSAGLHAPESIRGMRNLIVLAKIAGSIDPEMLHSMSDGISDATKRVNKAKKEQPATLWSILKRMRSERSRRALAAAADVLESVGAQLEKTKP